MPCPYRWSSGCQNVVELIILYPALTISGRFEWLCCRVGKAESRWSVTYIAAAFLLNQSESLYGHTHNCVRCLFAAEVSRRLILDCSLSCVSHVVTEFSAELKLAYSTPFALDKLRYDRCWIPCVSVVLADKLFAKAR